MLASCNLLPCDFSAVQIIRRNGIEKVKRSLFGPVDHEYNQRFLTEQLQIDQRQLSSKYNYDFENDCPMKPEGGEFVWKQASPLCENRKRKTEDCPDEAATMYFQPIEPECIQIEAQFKAEGSNKFVQITPKQCKITDFMPKTKRSGMPSNKETPSSEERPRKIARFGDCSS